MTILKKKTGTMQYAGGNNCPRRLLNSSRSIYSPVYYNSNTIFGEQIVRKGCQSFPLTVARHWVQKNHQCLLKIISKDGKKTPFSDKRHFSCSVI